MSDLRTQLVEAGIAPNVVESMGEDQLKNVARSMGISLPREVEIKDHKGAKYVVTDSFTVPKYDNEGKVVEGKTSQARNLFLRVEAIDQAIEDLLAAKGLLEE